MIRIGIDTFGCDAGKSGVSLYIRQVLNYMPQPPDVEFEAFGLELEKVAFLPEGRRIGFMPVSYYWERNRMNLFWHQFLLPIIAKQRHYSVAFFPAATRRLAPNVSCRSVGTIHDLAPWHFRKPRTVFREFYRDSVVPNRIRRLDRVIAVSEATRKDLVETIGVDPERITVIHNGIDLDRYRPRDQGDLSIILIQPFAIKRPYILYVSRIDHPVKNHVTLIRAFNIFKKKTGAPHKLVFAGSDMDGANVVHEEARSSPYADDIVFTGYFPPESLPMLYAGADIFAFPSRFEGFGVPVVEAMASGIPVVCSNISSLPEVAGDAAILVDPDDAAGFAEGFETLMNDRALYALYREKGIVRAQSFSWSATADKTFETLMQLASGG